MGFFIFCCSLILIVYTVIGYPFLLWVGSLFLNRKIDKAAIFPDVTMVIPVYNEEKTIGTKLKNCMDIDYPEGKLKILVVSDASTDQTEAIAGEFESDNIRVLRLPVRGGKVMAQNQAVRFCQTPVIIFTDVAITLDKDCVRLIVENFNDPVIGAVSCRDVVIDSKGTLNREKNYIQYDMLVRKYTSKIGTLIGVTGGFYAVRASIAGGGWNPAFPPDFYAALRCIKKNMRVIEDPRVKAYYKITPKRSDELTRKVRTINRGIHALFSSSNLTLLNPFQYGFASVELISQKVLRWLLPVFFIFLLMSNFFIFQVSIFATLFLLLQLMFYGIGAYGFLIKKKRKIPIFFSMPVFFIISNLSILIAFFEFFSGKKHITWQPTKR